VRIKPGRTWFAGCCVDFGFRFNRITPPRNIKWFAVAAAGALILAGIVVWTIPSTQAFVPAPKLSQIDPVQIMTSAKDADADI
jgi:hypothetical protein